MNYSQHEEERYILGAFTAEWKDENWDKPRRFLDIGAWNPKTFSNTRMLAELGWYGVFVEPSPGPSIALIKEYGKDFSKFVCIQAAVDLVNRLVPMHITDDAVTTTSDAEFEKWKDAVNFYGLAMVPSITLEEIANQFGGFDFVSVDAEGISVDLFKAALVLGWAPRCWCVEHNDRLGELLTAATERGYVAVMTNACNVVLVKRPL
jgi:FkbM family methyltransferase